MVDLQTQYSRLRPEIDQAIQEVLESTQFINGAPVGSFAENLAAYLGVRHVIPCANGTDALQIALMALDLQPGDEVITTPFTFVA
ncbi:MAG: DegT/DnrJ/EryC1/StrS family aminotransferase, partial [Saprospiraceae bacterium]|nr:DegT/DnrJ/EryC1/StrS family aminotransferase [Saprospiraceae bacterium]